MCDFEKNVEEIKSKMENLKLSESAKERILKKMDSEIEKINLEENVVLKNKKFSLFRNKKNSSNRKILAWKRSLVTICTACVIVTTCAFADEIEDNMGFFFKNNYREIQMADVNLNSVDMDYITHDGVSIKIDNYLIQDDSLYLVFNVKSEEEFNRCFLEEYRILNEKNEVIFDNKNYYGNNSDIILHLTRIGKKEIYLFIKIKNDNFKYLENNKELKINISKVIIGKEMNFKILDYKWTINITK